MTSYYAVPEEPGRKAYELLVRTLQQSGYAALAKVAMYQHEYVVIVRPYAITVSRCTPSITRTS